MIESQNFEGMVILTFFIPTDAIFLLTVKYLHCFKSQTQHINLKLIKLQPVLFEVGKVLIIFLVIFLIVCAMSVLITEQPIHKMLTKICNLRVRKDACFTNI